MATEQEVFLATEHFDKLSPANQLLLKNLACGAITPEHNHHAVLALLDQLKDIEIRFLKSQYIDVYDKKNYRKQESRGKPPAVLVSFMLQHTHLNLLQEDPVWPSFVEVMRLCTGFVWSRDPDNEFYNPMEAHQKKRKASDGPEACAKRAKVESLRAEIEEELQSKREGLTNSLKDLEEKEKENSEGEEYLLELEELRETVIFLQRNIEDLEIELSEL